MAEFRASGLREFVGSLNLTMSKFEQNFNQLYLLHMNSYLSVVRTIEIKAAGTMAWS